MHPVIRITTFLVYCLFTALGYVKVLSVAAVVLLMYIAVCRFKNFHVVILSLRRMRWFFISIVILYFWFTPGRPWIEVSESWAIYVPTIEGTWAAMHRLLSLALIVIAVHYLVSGMPRQQLVSALVWLVKPFSRSEDFSRRFSVRIALTLDYAMDIRALYEKKDVAADSLPSPGKINALQLRMQNIGLTAYRIFESVMQKAALAGTDIKSLDNVAVKRPELVQWIIPLGVTILFMSIGWIK